MMFYRLFAVCGSKLVAKCMYAVKEKIKKASRRGGCTNQIPLTIKPYPMPPSYERFEYASILFLN
jgi:hypothetical protein